MTNPLVSSTMLVLIVILPGVACNQGDPSPNVPDKSLEEPASKIIEPEEESEQEPEPEPEKPPIISVGRCLSYLIGNDEAASPKDPEANVFLVVRVNPQLLQPPAEAKVTVDGEQFDKAIEVVTGNFAEYVFPVPKTAVKFELHLTGNDPIPIEAEGEIQEVLPEE